MQSGKQKRSFLYNVLKNCSIGDGESRVTINHTVFTVTGDPLIGGTGALFNCISKMRKPSREVLLLFIVGALILGFYQMGVMDSEGLAREPFKNILERINDFGSEYLRKVNITYKEENITKILNEITTTVTTLSNLLTSQVFNISLKEAAPSPEVSYKLNKFKSPLSVPYRDLPYIDDITTEVLAEEKDIPQLHPTLYKEKNYTSKTPLKKILMWNDAYSNPHFGFGFGQEPFLLAKCPVNTCFTFHDRKKFPYTEWDAIVWHFRSNDKSLPQQRSNHTRYVFWMMESAAHLYGNIKPYNGKFNWTMLYRMDSDIYHPYGMVYKRRALAPLSPYIDYAANKTKMAAWFVSNCYAQSGRDKLTDSLQKQIQVDVYGKCGKYQCERKYQHSHCLQMLQNDYKFYFSFENSLCRDYVTEKFFNILSYNVIPVVYGFGNYSQQAPPHSYIDVLDFPNVTALADYLKYLDRNHTAYNEYFEWKRYYENLAYWPRVARSWCKLCELLHTDNSPKVYTDLYKWFVTESHCKNTNTKSISDFVRGKG